MFFLLLVLLFLLTAADIPTYCSCCWYFNLLLLLLLIFFFLLLPSDNLATLQQRQQPGISHPFMPALLHRILTLWPRKKQIFWCLLSSLRLGWVFILPFWECSISRDTTCLRSVYHQRVLRSTTAVICSKHSQVFVSALMIALNECLSDVIDSPCRLKEHSTPFWK